MLELAYANPTHPGLGIECFSLAELRRRMPAGFFRRTQRPRFHLLSLYVEGEGLQEIDFVSYRCTPGTVLHVHPGQVVRYVDVARADALMVLFTPEFAWTEADDRAPVSHLVPGDLSAIRANFGAIGEEYATTPPSEPILRHLLMALLLRLDRETAASRVPQETFARFRRLLEVHILETRKVEAYAALLGCASRTLQRAALAATGSPAKQLIDARAALEAKRLLAHTQLTVGEIAARLSFSEPTNFVKFFRRETGQLPLAFRATYRR
jgi:AraC-like DNA-binding protein